MAPAEGAAPAHRPAGWAVARIARASLLVPAAALAAAPTSSHMTSAGVAGLARAPQAIAAVAKGMSPADLVPLTPASAIVANHRRPFDGGLFPLAPFRFAGGVGDQLRAVDCLAAAAYYEAGDDPDGQRAVVQVVLNRVRHPAFPKSVCGVVFQGSERRTGCQFTFTCDGALARVPSQTAWFRARAVASAALAGASDPRVGTATHYHADYVVPYWSASLVKLAQVGAHIFYRWPGQWGRPGAFLKSGSGAEPAVSFLARLDPANGGALREDGDVPKLAFLPVVPMPGSAAPALAKSAPSSARFMLADQSAGPGRWALSALNSCAGGGDCQVFVYGSGDQLERNRHAPADRREAPLFLLIRDAASGMTVSLWDCRQIERPNPGQCLPDSAAELRRLLRDRPAPAARQPA